MYIAVLVTGNWMTLHQMALILGYGNIFCCSKKSSLFWNISSRWHFNEFSPLLYNYSVCTGLLLGLYWHLAGIHKVLGPCIVFTINESLLVANKYCTWSLPWIDIGPSYHIYAEISFHSLGQLLYGLNFGTSSTDCLLWSGLVFNHHFWLKWSFTSDLSMEILNHGNEWLIHVVFWWCIKSIMETNVIHISGIASGLLSTNTISHLKGPGIWFLGFISPRFST